MTPISLLSRTGAPSSASICSARNTNKSTPDHWRTKVSARRFAASRMTNSCAGSANSSPTSRCRASCIACWCAPPHAHARILRIDTAAALAQPGVVAVLTGADMAADNVGPMAPLWAIKSGDGKPMAEPPRFALARGTVRHVGEAVAIVIADSAAIARDAADLVQVDYEPLPAVVDAKAAMRERRAAAASRRRPAMSASGLPAAMKQPCARRSPARRTRAPRSGQQSPDRRGDRAARDGGRRQCGRTSSRSTVPRRCRISSAAPSASN